MNSTHNYCIIMAGGIGRRLWPSSRRNCPKQFIDFFGVGRTLLQQTYDRYRRFIPEENIYVSTFKDYVPLVQEQLPQLPESNILAEPVQLSTAPAAAWVSCHIGLKDPEANIIASPADHFITNEDKFVEQLQHGLEFVSEHGEFLAIGVKPTVPNTAYGYIQTGESCGGANMFRIKSFTEKPAMEYARMFVNSGEFLWNTGLFLWHAPTMLRFIGSGTGHINEAASRNVTSLSEAEGLELVKTYYPASLHRSLDLMILDQCENVYVQQGDFGWADVGCWPELYEVSEKDVDGNAILSKSPVLLSGCKQNTVRLPEGMGAVINGLEGYLVALEGNLLVICPNNDPALVRRLVNETQVALGESYT